MSFAPAGPSGPQVERPSLEDWAQDKLAWTCEFSGENDDGFDKI
ncbi:hypothetical protein [Martelella mediterranea]|nr:hypothetical protein [Martelella mediterranea]